jgi:hypothetical protein
VSPPLIARVTKVVSDAGNAPVAPFGDGRHATPPALGAQVVVLSQCPRVQPRVLCILLADLAKRPEVGPTCTPAHQVTKKGESARQVTKRVGARAR